ncbi:MAG TPA: diaminopimelate epimerase [Gammaproteobacteria bacterium]|nr:diaminopimelate epimerase [Gammaproteobacteria bacterium]
MLLEFTKMHGLGNDFVVVDAVNQSFHPDSEQVRAIADRHFGVGCDQLLLVERAQHPGADFRYRIFNADGVEVEQCGNGARCFARFLRERGLWSGDRIRAETRAGIITLRIEPDGQVTVAMGVPRFQPEQIPFLAAGRRDRYRLDLDGTSVVIGVVSMGNPHAVLQVDDVREAPVAGLGAAIGASREFPQGVNVGFMQPVSGERIRLRVFERGVGETLACGSGACAAMVVARQWGLVDDRVMVELPGGSLQIRWEGGESQVFMTGPATTVFEGRMEL